MIADAVVIVGGTLFLGVCFTVFGVLLILDLVRWLVKVCRKE